MLNNPSQISSIKFFYSCTYSLRGLDLISQSVTLQVAWQYSVEFAGLSTRAKKQSGESLMWPSVAEK